MKKISKESISMFFFKCMLPIIFLFAIYFLFEELLKVYSKTKEFIDAKTFTYVTIKTELLLLLGIFSPIRFIANCLYVTDLVLPNFKKFLNVVLKILNILIPIILGISYIFLICFIVQDIFLIQNKFFEIIKNFYDSIFQKLITSKSFYEIYAYFIVLGTILLMIFPKNINFIFSIQKRSIFRRLLLFIIYIPCKIIDSIISKLNDNKISKTVYNYVKDFLFMLPNNIATEIKDLVEIKEAIEDEGFDEENPQIDL